MGHGVTYGLSLLVVGPQGGVGSHRLAGGHRHKYVQARVEIHARLLIEPLDQQRVQHLIEHTKDRPMSERLEGC